MICPAGHLVGYPARELSTYSLVTELLRYVNLHALAMLYLWCSSPPVNMFVKKKILVTSVGKQHCYEAWGLLTEDGSACRPRYSHHPHPNLCGSKCHEEIQRTLKMMLHNRLKAKNKSWRTVACISFNIHNKYFSNNCVLLNKWKKGGVNICYLKRFKHFKTVYNYLYLQCLFTISPQKLYGELIMRAQTKKTAKKLPKLHSYPLIISIQL